MSEQNSTPFSNAPQNVAFFSDGNVLRDLGKIEGRIEGHDRELKECKDEIGKIRESVALLKEWRAYVLGGAGVIALIVSVLFSLVFK